MALAIRQPSTYAEVQDHLAFHLFWNKRGGNRARAREEWKQKTSAEKAEALQSAAGVLDSVFWARMENQVIAPLHDLRSRLSPDLAEKAADVIRQLEEMVHAPE